MASSEDSHSLPPYIQGQEFQGELAKRANLQHSQDMQITESGFLGETGGIEGVG